MTVATEASYAERIYTGVETIFTPGIQALLEEHVSCGYLDRDSLLPVDFQRGVHFTVTLDSSNAVTIGRIAFPAASPLNPLTIWIERSTPATQGQDFENLGRYNPEVHERLADAAAMRAAELRNRQDRTVTPFAVSTDAVDMRPRRVKAADPVDAEDLATKGYVDEHTGTAAAEEAKGYRDEVAANAVIVAANTATAVGAANLAEAYAAILENPDDGLYSDTIGSSIDDGTYL